MILRFDSVGGASGDMILGALADLGADLEAVMRQVRETLPEPFGVTTEALTLAGLRGTRVSVDVHAHEAHAHAAHAHEAHGHAAHAHAAHAHAAHGHEAHAHAAPSHAAHAHEAHAHAAHAHAAHTHAADAGPPRGRRHGHGHGTEPHHHGHARFRNLPAIVTLLESSKRSPDAAALAIATFRRLAEAEAAVHGTTVERVHFHEVGAVDAVVDIFGACLALEQLGVTAVSVGPLPEGQGTLSCEHGVMPIPAPATAELLRGHPVTRVEEPFELVTPTGAALLMTWKDLLPAPATYRPVRNGVGFGHRALRARPNLLRATLAEPVAAAAPAEAADAILLLEATLDDCPGEWLGAALERLLAAGALDVWHTPVQMKKNRPGVLLSVLCEAPRAEILKAIVFAETTTFGIRERDVRRTVLEHRIETADTPYGPVRVRVGSWQGVRLAAQPEYEDCRRLSEQHGVAARVVFDAAKAARGR